MLCVNNGQVRYIHDGSWHRTYHSDMNGFLQKLAVDGLGHAFVVSRVIPAGLLDVEPSAILRVDGGEVPVADAPPDQAWHVDPAF